MALDGLTKNLGRAANFVWREYGRTTLELAVALFTLSPRRVEYQNMRANIDINRLSTREDVIWFLAWYGQFLAVSTCPDPCQDTRERQVTQAIRSYKVFLALKLSQEFHMQLEIQLWDQIRYHSCIGRKT